MGYEYGIKQCRETLILLSSEESFENRMVSAFSEIKVIQPEDVSKEHFREINDLHEEYLSVNTMAISSDRSLQDENKKKQFAHLANRLVWLCTEIIEKNTRKN